MNCRFAFFTQWTVNILKAFSTRRGEQRQLFADSCLSYPSSNIYFHHYMKSFFYALWMELHLSPLQTAQSQNWCIKNILFIFFAVRRQQRKVKWKNGHKKLMPPKSLHRSECEFFTENMTDFIYLKRMMNFSRVGRCEHCGFKSLVH